MKSIPPIFAAILLMLMPSAEAACPTRFYAQALSATRAADIDIYFARAQVPTAADCAIFCGRRQFCRTALYNHDAKSCALSYDKTVECGMKMQRYHTFHLATDGAESISLITCVDLCQGQEPVFGTVKANVPSPDPKTLFSHTALPNTIEKPAIPQLIPAPPLIHDSAPLPSPIVPHVTRREKITEHSLKTNGGFVAVSRGGGGGDSLANLGDSLPLGLFGGDLSALTPGHVQETKPSAALIEALRSLMKEGPKPRHDSATHVEADDGRERGRVIDRIPAELEFVAQTPEPVARRDPATAGPKAPHEDHSEATSPSGDHSEAESPSPSGAAPPSQRPPLPSSRKNANVADLITELSVRDRKVAFRAKPLALIEVFNGTTNATANGSGEVLRRDGDNHFSFAETKAPVATIDDSTEDSKEKSPKTEERIGLTKESAESFVAPPRFPINLVTGLPDVETVTRSAKIRVVADDEADDAATETTKAATKPKSPKKSVATTKSPKTTAKPKPESTEAESEEEKSRPVFPTDATTVATTAKSKPSLPKTATSEETAFPEEAATESGDLETTTKSGDAKIVETEKPERPKFPAKTEAKTDEKSSGEATEKSKTSESPRRPQLPKAPKPEAAPMKFPSDAASEAALRGIFEAAASNLDQVVVNGRLLEPNEVRRLLQTELLKRVNASVHSGDVKTQSGEKKAESGDKSATAKTTTVKSKTATKVESAEAVEKSEEKAESAEIAATAKSERPATESPAESSKEAATEISATESSEKSATDKSATESSEKSATEKSESAETAEKSPKAAANIDATPESPRSKASRQPAAAAKPKAQFDPNAPTDGFANTFLLHHGLASANDPPEERAERDDPVTTPKPFTTTTANGPIVCYRQIPQQTLLYAAFQKLPNISLNECRCRCAQTYQNSSAAAPHCKSLLYNELSRDCALNLGDHNGKYDLIYDKFNDYHYISCDVKYLLSAAKRVCNKWAATTPAAPVVAHDDAKQSRKAAPKKEAESSESTAAKEPRESKEPKTSTAKSENETKTIKATKSPPPPPPKFTPTTTAATTTTTTAAPVHTTYLSVKSLADILAEIVTTQRPPAAVEAESSSKEDGDPARRVVSAKMREAADVIRMQKEEVTTLKPTLTSAEVIAEQIPATLEGCFERVDGRILRGTHAGGIEHDVSLAECECHCTTSLSSRRYAFQCVSAMYFHNERDCVLNLDNRQLRPESFVATSENVSYVGLICPLQKALELHSHPTCRLETTPTASVTTTAAPLITTRRRPIAPAPHTDECFLELPDYVLEGTALAVEPNVSPNECKCFCMDAERRYGTACQSVEYYFDTQTCLLSADNRLDEPQRFNEDPSGQLHSYMELTCRAEKQLFDAYAESECKRIVPVMGSAAQPTSSSLDVDVDESENEKVLSDGKLTPHRSRHSNRRASADEDEDEDELPRVKVLHFVNEESEAAAAGESETLWPQLPKQKSDRRQNSRETEKSERREENDRHRSNDYPKADRKEEKTERKSKKEETEEENRTPLIIDSPAADRRATQAEAESSEEEDSTATVRPLRSKPTEPPTTAATTEPTTRRTTTASSSEEFRTTSRRPTTSAAAATTEPTTTAATSTTTTATTTAETTTPALLTTRAYRSRVHRPVAEVEELEGEEELRKWEATSTTIPYRAPTTTVATTTTTTNPPTTTRSTTTTSTTTTTTTTQKTYAAVGPCRYSALYQTSFNGERLIKRLKVHTASQCFAACHYERCRSANLQHVDATTKYCELFKDSIVDFRRTDVLYFDRGTVHFDSISCAEA